MILAGLTAIDDNGGSLIYDISESNVNLDENNLNLTLLVVIYVPSITSIVFFVME